MMKLKLMLLILCIGKLAFGQMIYEGQVIDISNNQPIEGVNIRIKGLNKGTVSDANGDFKLEISKIPVSLIFSHVGFNNQEKLIKSTSLEKKVTYLLPETTTLTEIEVTPEKKVEAISDNEGYSIKDFEVLDGSIYRLEVRGFLNKHSLSVTNLNGEVLSTLSLEGIKWIEGFYKSCTDQLYIVSANFAYSILNRDDELQLKSKIHIDTFTYFIKTCKLRKGPKLYYINEFHNGLVSEISMYDVEKEEQKRLRRIASEDLLRGYKEDYGFILRSQQAHNMGDIYIAENEMIRNLQENGDFLLTTVYKPEYPIWISRQKEKIVLLNHIEQQIEIYENDILSSEVAIEYVSDKKWLKEVRIDQMTEKIYGIFKAKGGVAIKEVSPETGETKQVGIINITIQYHQSIRIYDGYVFYLKPSTVNNPSMELFRYKLGNA